MRDEEPALIQRHESRGGSKKAVPTIRRRKTVVRNEGRIGTEKEPLDEMAL